MRKFDFYEFAGILVPGTLFLAGLVYFWPGVIASDSLDKISIGGLGLFTLLAYVSGHLIQAIGDWIEEGWWLAGGGTKRASRVDTFNGNYGLHRGLVAAALLLLTVSPMSEVTTSASTIVLVIVAAVGTSGKHLFGK